MSHLFEGEAQPSSRINMGKDKERFFVNNFFKHSFCKRNFCKHSIKTVLATTLIASVNAAYANSDIKWNELSVGYENYDNDLFSRTGVRFSGVKLLDNNVFIRGQYSILSGEDTFFSRSIDEDLNWLSFGVGYKGSVDENTDLFATLSYEHLVFDESGVTFSEKNTTTGRSLELGVRTLVASKLEILGSLHHLDPGSNSANGYRIGARYYFYDQFSAGVSLLKLDETERLNISGIWHF